MIVSLWFLAALISALLIGLLGLGAGVYLFIATDDKKNGVFVLIFGVMFFLCPLLLFLAVMINGRGGL